jgi:hypothetical protein
MNRKYSGVWKKDAWNFAGPIFFIEEFAVFEALNGCAHCSANRQRILEDPQVHKMRRKSFAAFVSAAR